MRHNNNGLYDSGKFGEMMPDPDRAFWLAVYRGLMAIAAAIKRYKLDEIDTTQEAG
jgi:hypothetical protein